MTNDEFKALMELKKVFKNESISLPFNGGKKTYDLESTSTRDKFYLDIDRKGRIELSKSKLQERHVQTKTLMVRLDIDSPPHRNPDGSTTSRNHIHIYRETDGDTGNLPWAYDLKDVDAALFQNNTTDFMENFFKFCQFCNIDVNNVRSVI